MPATSPSKNRPKQPRLLLSELNHRVKNTLASVQAIVQQTLRNAKDPVDLATGFAGRIQSLARVHSLLTDTTWQGADLGTLIRDHEKRLTARGPAVRLEPQRTLHLALMLHELGTNTIKYGALSRPAGRVTISWAVKGRAAPTAMGGTRWTGSDRTHHARL